VAGLGENRNYASLWASVVGGGGRGTGKRAIVGEEGSGTNVAGGDLWNKRDDRKSKPCAVSPTGGKGAGPIRVSQALIIGRGPQLSNLKEESTAAED